VVDVRSGEIVTFDAYGAVTFSADGRAAFLSGTPGLGLLEAPADAEFRWTQLYDRSDVSLPSVGAPRLEGNGDVALVRYGSTELQRYVRQLDGSFDVQQISNMPAGTPSQHTASFQAFVLSSSTGLHFVPDFDAGNVITLVEDSSYRSPTYVLFRDGRRILYEIGNSFERSLTLFSMDAGGNPLWQRLDSQSDVPGTARGFALSPDETKLVFETEEQLWAFGLDGHPPETPLALWPTDVAKVPNLEGGTAFSADGRFFTAYDSNNVYVVDWSGELPDPAEVLSASSLNFDDFRGIQYLPPNAIAYTHDTTVYVPLSGAHRGEAQSLEAIAPEGWSVRRSAFSTDGRYMWFVAQRQIAPEDERLFVARIENDALGVAVPVLGGSQLLVTPVDEGRGGFRVWQHERTPFYEFNTVFVSVGDDSIDVCLEHQLWRPQRGVYRYASSLDGLGAISISIDASAAITLADGTLLRLPKDEVGIGEGFLF
jgi:hypothetical protein